MNDTTPRPKTRTWETMTSFTAYGEHWSSARHTVTLTRDAHGIMTGQPTEAYLTPAAIGKARACELHRLISRVAIPSGKHYGFAGAALDQPGFSLAALTELEAWQVWRFLGALFTSARTAA